MKHYLLGALAGIASAVLVSQIRSPKGADSRTSQDQKPVRETRDEFVYGPENPARGDNVAQPKATDYAACASSREAAYLRRVAELAKVPDRKQSIRSIMRLIQLNTISESYRSLRWMALQEAAHSAFAKLLSEGVPASELADIVAESKSMLGFIFLGEALAKSSVDQGLELINELDNEDELRRLTSGFFLTYFSSPPDGGQAYWSEWIDKHFASEVQDSARDALAFGYRMNGRYSDAFRMAAEIDDPARRLNEQRCVLFDVALKDPKRALELIRGSTIMDDERSPVYKALFRNLESSDPSVLENMRSHLTVSEQRILDSMANGR